MPTPPMKFPFYTPSSTPVPSEEENLALMLAQMQPQAANQALVQQQAQSIAPSAPPANSVSDSLVLDMIANQQDPGKTTGYKKVVKQQEMIDPDTYAQLQQLMLEDPSLQKIRGNQDKLQELVAASAPPAQTNLAPFMGLVDAWTGSNLAQSYKAPLTSAEHAKLIAGLQDMVQKGQLGVSDAEAAFIKSQLQGGETTSLQESSEGKKSGGSGAASFDREFRTNINKINDDLNTSKYSFSVIENALKTNDFSKLNNVKAIFARAVSGEKGVLTDADVDTRVLPQSIQLGLDKAASYFNEGNTKYDPAIAKNLQEMLDIAKEASVEKVKDRLGSVAGTYSSFPGFGESHLKAIKNTEGKLLNYSKDMEEQKKKKEALREGMTNLLKSMGK